MIGTILEQIDISSNPALKIFVASYSELKELDMSKNPELTEVIISEGTEVIGADGREDIIERLGAGSVLLQD